MATKPAPSTSVLRADAQRNRDRILVAAAEAFATTGPDTSVEEIACAAGVAVGTLYRRFPDRHALIRGVALMNFAKTVAEVQLAAQEERTGWDALVRIFGQEVAVGEEEIHVGCYSTVPTRIARMAATDERERTPPPGRGSTSSRKYYSNAPFQGWW